ncbi:unnamed protein product, partial [Laminaria digitata]
SRSVSFQQQNLNPFRARLCAQQQLARQHNGDASCGGDASEQVAAGYDGDITLHQGLHQSPLHTPTCICWLSAYLLSIDLPPQASLTETDVAPLRPPDVYVVWAFRLLCPPRPCTLPAHGR